MPNIKSCRSAGRYIFFAQQQKKNVKGRLCFMKFCKVLRTMLGTRDIYKIIFCKKYIVDLYLGILYPIILLSDCTSSRLKLKALSGIWTFTFLNNFLNNICLQRI